jgi:hypothetical protein
VLLLLLAAVLPPSTRGADDAFLTGYAAAVLERELALPGTVAVRDGVVTVRTRPLAAADRDRLVATLESVPGVRDVVVRELEAPAGLPSADVEPTAVPVRPPSRFLPRGMLFAPLHASPRWPHFAATYRYSVDDDELGNVGAADFGETIPLYRAAARAGGEWEAGIQAGVFSIFDLDAESADLVNADYMVAGFGAYRRGRLSGIARVWHQSSHLGDEFLLRNRVERINLSYEAADATLSYLVLDPLRLYAGGGGLFHREPATLEPWLAHWGAELVSPRRTPGGVLRPVLYANFESQEEHAWSVDVSLRGGVRVEGWDIGDRQLHLLAEWFDGHSPNGQFFRRRIETVGLGLHLFF